ncbi:MAG: hypothetical protein K1W26_06220 [Acetatifactor sp.]
MCNFRRFKIFFLVVIMEIWILMGCNFIPSDNVDIQEKDNLGGKKNAEEGQGTEQVEFLSASDDIDITQPERSEDMLAYWKVLNSKQPFVSVDEGYQEFYWDEYYWCLGEIRGGRKAEQFMIVDMDDDGASEVILECSPESIQVLHYENGIVYSFQFVFRGMKRVHNNGVYEGSDGAANTSYCKLVELNRDGYKEEEIASMDDNYYEVDGKEVSYEEFCECVEQIEDVNLAECMEFTESNLDEQFLGRLPEQDIALLKKLPSEKSIEDETDPLGHRQALRLYAAVLAGEQDVIFVTEDTFKYADETMPIYFSMLDLDGDGVQELVFECDYDVVWILHYRGEGIYGYHFRPSPVITTDGVFRTDREELSPTGYARITAFEEDGCRIEPVENYQKGSCDRVRYYYYSEETMAQWLEQDGRNTDESKTVTAGENHR